MSSGGKGGQAATGAGAPTAGNSIYNTSSAQLGGANAAYGAAGAMYGGGGLHGGASIYRPDTFEASQVQDPSLIASGISNYMNPYQQQVIDNMSQNVQRQTDMQQNVNGSNASAVGAFGGSRHGIVEAMTNSEGQKNIADFSSNLLNQGWTTAAQLSGQDVQNQMGADSLNANLAQGALAANQQSRNQAGAFRAGQRQDWRLAQNQDQMQRAAGLQGVGGSLQGLGGLSFDIGNQITNQQGQAGSLVQQLNQSILSGAQGQYEQFMGRPQNMLSTMLQSLGMNPLTNATTTTGSYTPGFLDYAGLGAQLGGGYMQMGQ